MAAPWVEAGYEAILVDPQHPEGVTVEGRVTKIGHIIDHPTTWSVLRDALADGRVVFVAGFPPCTDLAVSGARWFETKAVDDPAFQFKAMHVVWQCHVVAELMGAPYFIENPVSRISSFWRKRDHSFHPYQFTGLAPGDNYTKETCLWVGGGFTMPALDVAEDVQAAIAEVVDEFGRMVPKRKAVERFPESSLIADFYPDNRIHDCPPGEERANTRSATPEGFARAVFRANAPHLRTSLDDLVG